MVRELQLVFQLVTQHIRVKNKAKYFGYTRIAIIAPELQHTKRSSLRRVRKIAKSDYKLRHVCPSIHLSIRPNGATRLHCRDFHEIVIRNSLQSVKENQVLL
jgi:hypothetical protein